jgi:hypothetical protein
MSLWAVGAIGTILHSTDGEQLENLVRSRADRLDGKLHAYGFRTGVWSDDSPSP